ncbi:MAG: sulfate transporter family protein [Pseudolabrys sp.]
MLTAAATTLSQIFTPPLRAVLWKAIGLALLMIVLIGIGLQRLFAWLAAGGANWAETATGLGSHSVWSILGSILSVMASLGIITGALFLMPAVTAFVGSFFVDEIADHVERDSYPAEPAGRALPLFRALVEGIKIALLALVIYLLALPFFLFGIGLIVLFLANAYLLSREYFELAAMRFRPPAEAKAMRKRHAGYLFMAGMLIAAFVSIPIVNLATPLFAMTFMVHVHKRLSGARAELIVPAR